MIDSNLVILNVLDHLCNIAQELQQLIEDANQTLEETGGCSHEVVVVILHRDTVGGSVGITLAGGADYEAKEITVSNNVDFNFTENNN